MRRPRDAKQRGPGLVEALLLGLFLLPACAGREAATDAGDPSPGADAGTGIVLDGGPTAANDAGFSDGGGGGADGGSMPPSTGEYDDRSGLNGAAARMGCFDGLDNDGDGASDCSDTSCQLNVPSCCVGQSSETCCDPGVTQSLGLDTCDGPLADCVDAAAFATFGSPVPTVREGALVPGGQMSDSGALFLTELDPRRGSLRLRATIASSLSAPDAGLVEMVGVGFVDASVDPASVSRVVPLAGVVVSRNRQEILLMVAGEVAQRWSLGVETAITYVLELDPLGRVRLSTEPSIANADIPLAVSAPVRGVVYGRTANPTELTAPARVLDVQITPSVCDMPAALSRTADTVVPAPLETPGWADRHVAISEPDILRYFDPPGTEVVAMALNVDGEIHLARPGLGGFTLESRIGEPVLPAPTEDWALDGVSDPALAFDGSELHLYFTGWRDGLGTIAHGIWDPVSERFILQGPVPGLQATETTGYSAATPFDIDGVAHMALRVDDGESHRLSVYRMEEPALTIATVRQTSSSDVFAFDRDEVDAPTVLYRDGVYRMYFAGRRGTRWSIGLLVSDDGLAWRQTSENAVLTASGSGYDALGVRSPSVDVSGGLVHLYHTGDDGERLRIGAARAY